MMRFATFFVATLAASAASALGAINGPMFPPTNNVTFSGSGAPGSVGGKTNQYTGMSMTGVVARWWGDNGGSIINSLNNDAGETEAFNSGLSDLANGLAVFTGSSQFTWLNGSNFVTSTVGTRFTLRLVDLTNAPIPLVLGSSLSIPAAVVGQVDATDFKALFIFEAQSPTTGTWTPTNDLYNSFNTNQAGTKLSFGGGFYEQVPAPSAAAALGLLGLGVSRRRRA